MNHEDHGDRIITDITMILAIETVGKLVIVSVDTKRVKNGTV